MEGRNEHLARKIAFARTETYTDGGGVDGNILYIFYNDTFFSCLFTGGRTTVPGYQREEVFEGQTFHGGENPTYRQQEKDQSRKVKRHNGLCFFVLTFIYLGKTEREVRASK